MGKNHGNKSIASASCAREREKPLVRGKNMPLRRGRKKLRYLLEIIGVRKWEG